MNTFEMGNKLVFVDKVKMYSFSFIIDMSEEMGVFLFDTPKTEMR